MLHGFGKNKIAAIPAIKSVIENGSIISIIENYKNKGYDRCIISGKGKIDGTNAVISVVVKSYNNHRNKFYLHEVEIIEADVSSMTAPQLSVDTVNTSASNKSIPKSTENVNSKFSHRDSDGKNQYIVRSVVNKYSNEVKTVDVLYAINAKKETDALNAPRVSTPSTVSTISISDLLDIVKKYYPDILPEDVLKHYGYSERPFGELGESALYSARSLSEEDTIRVYEAAKALEGHLDELQSIWDNALVAAVNNYNAEGDANVSGEGEVRYSTRLSKDNIPVLVVNDDILSNAINDNEIVNTVKQSLTKFKKVPIKSQSIYFLANTKKEYTYSKYTKWLKNNDIQTYYDKMRVAGHPQDIVYATTDYINEGLKHKRKDSIKDFARGKILIDVSGRQYSAEVVIGFLNSGICELYDIVNINPTKIEYKKETTPKDIDSNESSRSGVTSTNSISGTSENVNSKFSHRDSDGNNLSQGQAEYFKNSKVRDEDGNLLVVYHGTDAEFTVFDKTKGRRNMDIQLYNCLCMVKEQHILILKAD